MKKAILKKIIVYGLLVMLLLYADTTGGEGLGASFICDYMKNSSLIYVYYPSIAYEYGTSKKLYEGTKPDYYASRTREEFLLRQQYVAEGVAWEYHNQLEHDAVLKWVVENLEK